MSNSHMLENDGDWINQDKLYYMGWVFKNKRTIQWGRKNDVTHQQNYSRENKAE